LASLPPPELSEQLPSIRRAKDNHRDQQIENYILQPTIIGKAAQISGFTVLASVLAFGALFGLIGAIIGVPIAAGIQILVEELTANRRARIAAADAADQRQPG
jgi:predicted PurR-regulated permease PerM